MITIVEIACKKCGKKFNQVESNYCPHCGFDNGNWCETLRECLEPNTTIRGLSEEELNALKYKYSK